MAISTRKRNKIIADAKAGKYKSITELCKHHKIDRGAYYNWEKKYQFKYGANTDFVEIETALKKAKLHSLSPQEIHSVEEASELQILKDDIALISLSGIKKMLVETTKGIDNQEYITPNDRRIGMSTLKDGFSVVAEKPTTQVNVQQNNTTEIKQIEVKFIE